MNSTDAMVILLDAFPLDGVLADNQANMAHLFGGDFPFAAAELDADTLRLSAQLNGLPLTMSALARRLLEANLSGVETGSGAMAPDPVGSGDYALVDTLSLAAIEGDELRLRVVDFMLYAEYWRAEGIAKLQAQMKLDAKARNGGGDQDVIVMRG